MYKSFLNSVIYIYGSDYKKPVLTRVIYFVLSILCAVYGFNHWRNGYFIGAFFVMECLCEFIPLLKKDKG